MTTKSMTLRLTEEQAAEVEAVSRADGSSVTETVRQAIDLLIAERRKDANFRARIREIIAQDREILDRLAE